MSRQTGISIEVLTVGAWRPLAPLHLRGTSVRPVAGDCENCGQRPAETVWIGEGGSLAFSRQYMQQLWCQRCALTAQLEHAREAAARIPELEASLAVMEDG